MIVSLVVLVGLAVAHAVYHKGLTETTAKAIHPQITQNGRAATKYSLASLALVVLTPPLPSQTRRSIWLRLFCSAKPADYFLPGLNPICLRGGVGRSVSFLSSSKTTLKYLSCVDSLRI